VRTEDSEIQRKAKLHEKFPVRELVKRGWIERSKDTGALEQQILTFYDLESPDDTPILAHAAKRSSEDVTMLQLTWLFRVRQIARTYVVKKYRAQALRDALGKLHALLTAPEELRKVSAVLNEAGVRLVLVEALPSSKIDGACLWLTPDQPVIALSARLDRIDNFWFVLRHEIEHLLCEHGKEAFLMLDEDLFDSGNSSTAEEEKAANAAASQFAVPDSELVDYMTRVKPYYFSEERVLGFSGRLGVHPGLVVGRLQKRLEKTGYPTPYKFLRSYLVKVRHILTQSVPTDGWGTIYPSK
jgi:HTH-type transcriptional regulator/antitoxin HigA